MLQRDINFCEKLHATHYFSDRVRFARAGKQRGKRGRNEQKNWTNNNKNIAVHATCSFLTTTRYLFIICHLVHFCWFGSHFVTFHRLLLLVAVRALTSSLLVLLLSILLFLTCRCPCASMWINYATYFFKGAKNLQAKITNQTKNYLFRCLMPTRIGKKLCIFLN